MEASLESQVFPVGLAVSTLSMYMGVAILIVHREELVRVACYYPILRRSELSDQRYVWMVRPASGTHHCLS